jgi:hypothetical protein
MRRVVLKESDRWYGLMLMAWMTHPKFRTITRQRASRWVVNDRLELIFKYSRETRTKKGRSWFFNVSSIEWPRKRLCVCLQCGTNMIVVTRGDLRNLEAPRWSRNRIKWIRVVCDVKGDWYMIGPNKKTIPLTSEGGLGYFLMHDRAKGSPRLRVI